MNNDAQHRTFVLIHGAWYGAWVWREILPRLRALGYAATAPTLTGLGERRHIGNDSANLETHIEDVVAHIEAEDLRDVTLVGWSYGGMVITGVLARVPERIKELIYLDAFMPDDGRAVVDYLTPEFVSAFKPFADEKRSKPPLPLSTLGVTDPRLVEFIEPRLGPQPWRTLFQPVKALKARPDIPVSAIVCTEFSPSPLMARLAELEADPTMRVIKLDAGHNCMLTNVNETVAALVGD